MIYHRCGSTVVYVDGGFVTDVALNRIPVSCRAIQTLISLLKHPQAKRETFARSAGRINKIARPNRGSSTDDVVQPIAHCIQVFPGAAAVACFDNVSTPSTGPAFVWIDHADIKQSLAYIEGRCLKFPLTARSRVIRVPDLTSISSHPDITIRTNVQHLHSSHLSGVQVASRIGS